MVQYFSELPLYKYLKKEYAEKLLNDGIFRIGTLYDFRCEESLGAVVGDRQEGKKTTDSKFKNEHWTSDNYPYSARSVVNVAGVGDWRINARNVTFEKRSLVKIAMCIALLRNIIGMC